MTLVTVEAGQGRRTQGKQCMSLLQWSRREALRGAPQGDGSGEYGLTGHNARPEMRSQGERGIRHDPQISSFTVWVSGWQCHSLR